MEANQVSGLARSGCQRARKGTSGSVVLARLSPVSVFFCIFPGFWSWWLAFPVVGAARLTGTFAEDLLQQNPTVLLKPLRTKQQKYSKNTIICAQAPQLTRGFAQSA